MSFSKLHIVYAFDLTHGLCNLNVSTNVSTNVGWLLLFGNHGLWSKLQNVFLITYSSWLLPKSNNQPTLVVAKNNQID
jgi:hypothetical protein